MANLNPLIRIRRHAVEQKQKFLADLYRQSEDLARQKETLETDLEKERHNVKSFGVEMLSYFGNYSKAVKDRVADIIDSMKRLDIRIESAREAMREAFAELKKIEITQARRETEQEAALKKKESAELDETALEIFRRRGK